MVTTLTAALVVELTAYIANVGNSRAYRYREREGLLQITRDHSLAARMVETSVITPEEAQRHPERRQLYRGLAAKPPLTSIASNLAFRSTIAYCSALMGYGRSFPMPSS